MSAREPSRRDWIEYIALMRVIVRARTGHRFQSTRYAYPIGPLAMRRLRGDR
jgi:hypothetical protein